jgi:biofilm protein TabA
MKKTVNKLVTFLAIICFFASTASAQTAESAATVWVKKGDRKNGPNLEIYKDVNDTEFAKQYQRNKAYWDKALAFIADTQLDKLPVGKHAIDSENVFATVTDGPTKDFSKTGWEAHRKYIDLHLMIRGKERIGMMDAATATVTNPYDATKDVMNFDVNTKGNYYIADPGTLFIFFPQNSHRPGIHVDGFDTVKKLVIKIRVAD